MADILPGSLWGSVRDFYGRGGFVNGLNPQIAGRIWYVDTINGNDGFTGRAPGFAGGAFATMAKAFTKIDSYDIIVASGVITEQVTAPLGVFDVTIIGGANKPRQATSGGVPTGGGAYWKPPTSPVAATALLTLREQAWKVVNVCFSPHISSPCIEAKRAETATYPDPSHLIIDGCYFIDGTTGIGYQDSGGCFNVLVQNSIFKGLATAIKGVAGAGIATPLMNKYIDNYFNSNTNDIVIGSAYGIIQRNSFKNTTTKKVSLTAGDHEIVTLNFFDDLAADIDPAHGYDGSATGTWANYTTNQAALQMGQPA